MSDDDLPEKAPEQRVKRFTPLKKLSRWRRISIGMYTPPRSAVVYGEQKLDATEILELIPQLRERSGERVSVSHVVVKIIGDMLAAYPHYNVTLRRRKFFMRRTADVFMQVAIREGQGDLGGITLREVNTKTVTALAREVKERAEKVRQRQDKEFEKGKQSLERTPALLMPLVIRFADILSNDLGVNLSFIGVKPDAWGGCMVTNVGSFGLSHGYAPLVPASRVPMLVLLGAIRDEPVVRDGQIVIRPMLTTTGTFDHRVYDGLNLAQINDFIKSRFEQPDWLRAELAALE
jgi:pyruvate/2-oxoglutarate dehydrogenase complex dihydrolipoamide acyltransferase (E2) component